MSKRVKFNTTYDHVWNSSATTNFPVGWSGPVKDEVAIAAIEKGFAVEIVTKRKEDKDE